MLTSKQVGDHVPQTKHNMDMNFSITSQIAMCKYIHIYMPIIYEYECQLTLIDQGA